MLQIGKTEVRSFDITYNDIIWTVKPTSEDTHNYTFTVLRSEAEFGPFIAISEVMDDTYRFRDSSVPSRNSVRTMFYVVRIRNVITGDVVDSPAFRKVGKLDNAALKIVLDHNVYLTRLAGTRCWAFPKKTFGQYCPSCFDEVIGKQLRHNCQLCWGTGFTGGYHSPVQVWAVVREPQEIRNNVRSGTPRQDQTYSITMGPSPYMSPDDMIIDSNNRRMKVMSIQGPTRDGTRLVQQVMCVRVAPGSVEDKIPLKVPEDLQLLTTEGKYNNLNIDDGGIQSAIDLFR